MQVGVRELKKHLSRYLDEAAKGTLIRVTERGRPKALLGPIAEQLGLERGLAEQWVRPGHQKPVRRVRRVRAQRKVMDVLREDRDA